jgi:hypothetical protein
MLFLDFKNKSSNQQSNTNNILFTRRSVFTTARPAPQTTPSPPAIIGGDPEKMKWGAPIWYLFHTLAHKIKDDAFDQCRLGLLKNIYIICNNLPCPTCTKHAVDYLNRINFNAIQTKQQLKLALFQFHNDVNRRKNVPIFSLDSLEEKYSTASTMNIIQYFMKVFTEKRYNPNSLANTLHRTNAAKQLTVWFGENIQYFDM